MSLKDWEKELIKHLTPLSKEEKKQIIDYYREIYGDKIDAGYTGEEVLEEFGAPEECAKKILADEGKTPIVKATLQQIKDKVTAHSAADITGLVFFTLFVGIPVFAALFSIVASFGAVAISGVATSLAGGLFTIGSPFYYGYHGLGFGGIVAHMGIGIAAIGIGILLAIAFYFATKYMAIATIKFFKICYFRRNQK